MMLTQATKCCALSGQLCVTLALLTLYSPSHANVKCEQENNQTLTLLCPDQSTFIPTTTQNNCNQVVVYADRLTNMVALTVSDTGTIPYCSHFKQTGMIISTAASIEQCNMQLCPAYTKSHAIDPRAYYVDKGMYKPGQQVTLFPYDVEPP